jgi:hypothetical protein
MILSCMACLIWNTFFANLLLWIPYLIF